MTVPKLLADWKQILKNAWSVKFTIAALVFGCGEAIIALVQPAGVPVGVLAAASIVASIGALISRTLAQGEDTKALAKEVAQEIVNGQPTE